MIDEKKIKEAAKAYCDSVYGTVKKEPFVAEGFRQGFRQGTEWAQQEFIDSLWHDASEEPSECNFIVAMDGIKGDLTSFFWYGKFEKYSWRKCVYDKSIERWCYLSDIMPTDCR